MKKSIAIIPVKAHSERMEGKNFRVLGGRELWVWSVEYALEEGIEPVVSTDSEHVEKWCEAQGVRCVREVVDDRDLCNCVNQVLAVVECDFFVLLQPTSPIRKPGLVRDILSEGVLTSIYSAEKVKMIGHVGDVFHDARRDQDADTRFLQHFDGNILVVNAGWYRATRRLFCNVSGVVEQQKPYTLQIDVEDDFKVVKKIIEL